MIRQQIGYIPKVIRSIEKRKSQINGIIEIEERQEFGVLISIGGLSQSGGAVTKVWYDTLRQLASYKKQFKKCLILGLGGGTLVGLLKKCFPNTKIVGVEIDPVMVELGKKYLGLSENDVDIIIEDAHTYINQSSIVKNNEFDLILVDIYLGRSVPKKFDSEKYIMATKRLAAKEGIIIFNRVNLSEDETRNRILFQNLQRNFPKVIPHFINDNLTLICFTN